MGVSQVQLTDPEFTLSHSSRREARPVGPQRRRGLRQQPGQPPLRQRLRVDRPAEAQDAEDDAEPRRRLQDWPRKSDLPGCPFTPFETSPELS